MVDGHRNNDDQPQGRLFSGTVSSSLFLLFLQPVAELPHHLHHHPRDASKVTISGFQSAGGSPDLLRDQRQNTPAHSKDRDRTRTGQYKPFFFVITMKETMNKENPFVNPILDSKVCICMNVSLWVKKIGPCTACSLDTGNYHDALQLSSRYEEGTWTQGNRRNECPVHRSIVSQPFASLFEKCTRYLVKALDTWLESICANKIFF